MVKSESVIADLAVVVFAGYRRSRCHRLLATQSGRSRLRQLPLRLTSSMVKRACAIAARRDWRTDPDLLRVGNNDMSGYSVAALFH